MRASPPYVSRILPLILVVALVFPTLSAALVGNSETFESQPLLAPIWRYRVKGWCVVRVSWSPQGLLAALLLNEKQKPRVMVFKNGRMIWDSGEINYYLVLFPIPFPLTYFAWSARGDQLATLVAAKNGVKYLLLINPFRNYVKAIRPREIGEKEFFLFKWNPRYDDIVALYSHRELVVVNTTTGKTLWSTALTPPIYDAAWSPNGEILAVAAASRVIAFDRRGHKLWDYEAPEYAKQLSWSSDGRLLAVGLSEWNTTLVFEINKLVVLDRNGAPEWSTNNSSYRIEAFAWGPNDILLASIPNARFGCIKVYDSQGRLLKNALTPSSSSFCFDTILKSPKSGQFLLEYSPEVLALLDLSSHKIIWRDILGGPTSVTEEVSIDVAAWSPDGRFFAIPIGCAVLVYGKPHLGWLGTIAIKGEGKGRRLYFFTVLISDGVIIKEYSVESGRTLLLYATPGNYTIKYYSPIIIPLSAICFNAPEACTKPITLNVTVKSGRRVTITLSAEKLLALVNESLGRIILKAPSNSLVILEETGTNQQSMPGSLRIGKSREVLIYIKPGKYKVKLKIGGITYDAGTITIHGGDLIRLDLTSFLHKAKVETLTSGAPTRTISTTSNAGRSAARPTALNVNRLVLAGAGLLVIVAVIAVVSRKISSSLRPTS